MNRFIVGPDGYGQWKSTRMSDSYIMFRGGRDSVLSSTEVYLKAIGGGMISLQGEDGDIVDNFQV